eukprot:jgi/Ulvmu1/3076/UM015_0116.1
MSRQIHDAPAHPLLSSSLSTCENFSSTNQFDDVNRSFSSDRSFSQAHLRYLDGPDAWIHDADLSPSDPLSQWYNKTNRSTEWRDRVDRILHQIMAKDLRQQAPCDQEAEERLRLAVKQVLDHLNMLKEELEQTNLQDGLLQMPSDAFRNRTDSLDCNAAIGPPSCESEHLPMAQCIQEVLFRLLDLQQPHIQFRVATICLAMSPTPNTALDMARVLYQLSKESSNDALFAEFGLIPAIVKYLRQVSKSGLRRDSQHDAAVLLVAVLKNATLDPRNRFRVAEANGPLVLSYLLRSEAVKPQIRQPSEPAALDDDAATTLAVQAIGVVRNLAASQELLHVLRDGDTLKGLRGALVLCGNDADVAFGVARVLCKLSLDPRTVMDTMAQPEMLRSFVRMATTYVNQPAINLRFTYAFGNLVSQSHENATSFTMVDGVIDYLAQSMKATIDCVDAEHSRTHNVSEARKSSAMSDAATPDAAAAAIGYFAANICTTAEAATPIARRSDIANASARLLMLCNKAAFYDASLHLVEFMRNITFYDRVSVLPDLDTPEAGGSAFLSLAPEVILRPVIPMMLSPAQDTAAAAAGAVGNMMRIPRAREYACRSCADEGLVLLLGSQTVNVVKAAAGALVNLACSCNGCAKLADLGVGAAVAEALVNGLGRAMAELDAYTNVSPNVRSRRVREMRRRELLEDGLKDCEELLQLLCCLLKWHVGSECTRCGPDSSSKEAEGDYADQTETVQSSKMGDVAEVTSEGDAEKMPSGVCTAEEYDLGEAFWREASALLQWLETFACMIDESEPRGEVLYKAKDALAGLMEDDVDSDGDVAASGERTTCQQVKVRCSSKGVEAGIAPASTSVALSSPS